MKQLKRLYIDIETSGNIVWTYSIGYQISISHDQIIKERAIICICYKWAHEDKVHSLIWSKKQNDKKMLEKIVPILESADEVIAHNGDRFDIKWMRTRAFLHKIPFPAYIKTIDTLKKARGKFNFNSNRLDYLSKVTGGSGKLDYGGIKVINEIVLNNDRDALEKYIEYCIKDVVELQRIYELMNPYIEPATHIGAFHGNGRYSCPHCGSVTLKRQGFAYSASGIRKQRIQCGSCSRKYQISETVYSQYMRDKADGLI